MINCTNGITLTIDPWSYSGAKLQSIRLYEELGGKIASGTASFELFMTEAAVNLIYKQYTGKITISKTVTDGNTLEIDFFVTKRRYIKNNLTIEFLCVKDNKFVTDLISLEHTDITQALNSLYPGKIDIRCESDVNNEIPLIQFNETNHTFCTKLAYSFKKDIIFAFGWEGFMIKDRCGDKNSVGKTENLTATINGSKDLLAAFGGPGTGIESMDPYVMSYDNILYQKVIDPWLDNEEKDYSEKIPVNLRTLRFYNRHLVVGTDYTELVSNYLYNQQMMTSNMQVSLRIKSDTMPNYKIGDIIIYNNVTEPVNPHRAYLVKTNEIYYSPDDLNSNKSSEFFWVSTLVSMFDPNGNKYPWESDPTIELDETGKLK